ncbi:hypothetical protein D0Z07_6587 [Hyphodiscus hymeniophilus]|uniref:Mitotic checkpoint regulator, MAD2B-interacting-domain-containing protein n=1 Tax=Hyphodiscus hymeniophilus TaxID=353542 RepID=A0A9P6VGZ5_9HELO|nr:hypothetical protein D0Z07_6587 [Hyphodiscus hymeniophilus]
MGLVDYSDSDASDVEEAPKVPVKAAANPSKPAFQKVVDRSNPGKIRVTLPQSGFKDEAKTDEPPAKKAKTGGGAFSGFNSFLPAPKRAGQATTTLGGGNAARKGLGSGVNLKTGAAPGFSREPEPERDYAEDTYEDRDAGASTSTGSGLSLPPPKAPQNGEQTLAHEVKLIGKPLMFKPLSVARKPAKKKKQLSPGHAAPAGPNPALTTPATPQPEKPAQRPKVSLFSMSVEPRSSATPQSTGDYQPMLYETNVEEDKAEDDRDDLEPSYEDFIPSTSHVAPPAVPTPPISQSLDDIAGDLNLSAAERRQLFGRQKTGRGVQSATKIINFNTDEEYLRNEELRAAGEEIVHNPVRAIAPGKHSLKQLVNAAQNQKEALEESFAKGKSNRAEASSRYGW